MQAEPADAAGVVAAAEEAARHPAHAAADDKAEAKSAETSGLHAGQRLRIRRGKHSTKCSDFLLGLVRLSLLVKL